MSKNTLSVRRFESRLTCVARSRRGKSKENCSPQFLSGREQRGFRVTEVASRIQRNRVNSDEIESRRVIIALANSNSVYLAPFIHGYMYVRAHIHLFACVYDTHGAGRRGRFDLLVDRGWIEPIDGSNDRERETERTVVVRK